MPLARPHSHLAVIAGRRTARSLVVTCLMITSAGALSYATARASEGHATMQESEDSLLVRRERAMWTALEARDTAAFVHLMGDGVVDVDISGIHRTTAASAAQFVANCATSNVVLSDLRVVHRNSSATVAYRATLTQSCWGQPAPSTLHVMTVYEHERGWAPVAHSETPAATR